MQLWDDMNILHLINGEFYSGAERVQDLLAMCLPDSGYQVTFCCLKPGKFASLRVATDAPVLDAPMVSRFDLSPVRLVSEIVRTRDFGLLHTHTPRAALIGRMVAGRCRIPMVHHVHSPTSRDTESWLRNFLNSSIENWSLRKCDRLIAVSHSLQQHLLENGFSQDIVRVVPNGVPVLSSPISWQAPADEWVIGCVALFRPRKGLEVLLEAMAVALANGLPVRLRAVGAFETAAYQQQIIELAHRLDIEKNIDWVGFTSDVVSELRRMHLFVLPSLYGEGLPMVVIEAMAAGVPVIGTRVEGVPEVLEPGNSGFVVPAGDAQALAMEITRVIKSPELAASASHAGLARQRERYSDISMAEGVAAVYREVAR